ncbi:hypothetical protein MGN70_011288 [Eutypa lata]|nr:hypothetical protein MGN70_011288 [Eutypa lata]
MTTAPPSPKRRHILSSINPNRPSIAEYGTEIPESAAPPAPAPGSPPPPPLNANGDAVDMPEAQQRKKSKFRFKSKHSSSHRSSRHRDRDRDQDRYRDRDRDRSQELEDGDDGGGGGGDRNEDDSTSTRRHHHRRRRHHNDNQGNDDVNKDHHHDDDNDDNNHHRHKRRRRHRHHRSRTRSPTPPNPYDPAPLSPEAAFRASLFDAMADDEGAAYWEGVYGQPMHVYSRGGSNTNPNNAQDNNDGSRGNNELNQMDDEEYAAYVRQKMWEKTHEGLLEERARREERKREKDAKEKEARRLTRDMEESLRRGEERKRRRGWRGRWEAYVRAWMEWDDRNNNNNNNKSGGYASSGGGGGEGPAMTSSQDQDQDQDQDQNQGQDEQRRRHPLENDADMAWPVESGRRADVRDAEGKTDAVREFFVRGLLDAAEEEEKGGGGEADFLARLKDERVRWHPDKIQQRLGGRVDDALMRDVTAVFQAVEGLWSDMRVKKKDV